MLLHSLFTIFIEDRMRFGKAKVQKNDVFYLSLLSPFTIFVLHYPNKTS